MTAIVITQNGKRVEVPVTIADVRAHLPEEVRDDFTRAAEHTDTADLLDLCSDWLMDHDPETNAALARLRAGDFTGTVSDADHLRACGVDPADYGITAAMEAEDRRMVEEVRARAKRGAA